MQGKQEVAAQLPAPATVRSPQAPVSSSGCVPAGGGWGGRRRACCLPAWLCCGLLSLACSLSQLTSQEFAPEPERQTRESPSAPPATAPSPSSVPRLKGATPRQPGQAGPGGQEPGWSVLMDQKSPKWKVLLPGELPGMAPRWAVEGVWVLGQCLDFPKLSRGGWGAVRRVLSCNSRGVCVLAAGAHSACVEHERSSGGRYCIPRRPRLSPGGLSGGVAEH